MSYDTIWSAHHLSNSLPLKKEYSRETSTDDLSTASAAYQICT